MINFFLQINITKEKEKFGLQEMHQITQCLELIVGKDQSTPLHFAGLMCMGSFHKDKSKEVFTKLQKIRTKIQEKYPLNVKISAGMSGDYLHSLALGSDYIRIGRGVFERTRELNLSQRERESKKQE